MRFLQIFILLFLITASSLFAQTITTGSIASPLCAGAPVGVSYTITGSYNLGNTFTAQLSNAAGAFTAPVNIGQVTSISNLPISATIPAGTAAGAGYRIRVVSSSPVIIGTPNPVNITINRIGITLSSAAGTNTQTPCINNAITNIVYTTTGATGASVSGLPAGVLGSSSSNTFTISGTPAVTGTFNYTVTVTGSCGTTSAAGSITVRANNTISLSSGAGTNVQTRCINTPITNITYTTTGATGASVTGLPTGVTGSFAANTVTISGVPTQSGTFNYTVTLTGGCGIISTTGSITVSAFTISTGTITTPLCAGTSLNVPYTTTGCTPGLNLLFTAQLSNALGSFASPVNIGSVSSNTSGIINALIPAATVAGTGYRIRVVSLTTNIIGSANPANITINAASNTSVNISSSVNTGQICANTSVNFTAVPVNGGTTPVFQWKLNGVNVGSNSSTYTNASWVNGDVVECVMTSNNNCAYPIAAWSNRIIVLLDNDVSDSWLQKSDIGYAVPNGPSSRDAAVGFSIGNKGYIGTGHDARIARANDFWEYDPATNVWTQRANIGGTGRINAVGFSIGNKGYIGTGYDGVRKNDFWEYDPVANAWTPRANFGGTAREGAVGFSIGNKGYIGTGFDGVYKQDFWEYDPGTDEWTQIASFGGAARSEAVGFSIGNKGYVGTGSDVGVGRRNDFWEYDPITDVWTSRANFGGTARDGAVGFSIGNKGYIGTGYDGVRKNDFWEYDPVSNVWTLRANFGGNVRTDAVGFGIGSLGYVGTGFNYTYFLAMGLNIPVNYNDFWVYNPATNGWTQTENEGGKARTEAIGFSIGSKGYIGTGHVGGTRMKDFWEYDPVSNLWTQRADFGGTARYGAVGFGIGNKGYVGTGNDGVRKTDFWEYDPVSNVWTPRANFGGTARQDAVGFSIGNKGYIGTGNDGVRTNDFWEYDPVTNVWAARANFGGPTVEFAVGFSIGNKGYIGSGADGISYSRQFWEYNPVTNVWIQRANVGGGSRKNAVGFSIGNKGYFGTGDAQTVTSYSGDFWEYNPDLNVWTQRADVGGPFRSEAVGFCIGNKGYIGSGSFNYQATFYDFWEYSPVNTRITTGSITTVGPYCSGNTITVPFTLGCHAFSAGNVFTVELSDNLGSFSNPVTLTTVSSTTSQIVATIPTVTQSSALYQIRVVGSNPSTIGLPSPTLISINSPNTISLSSAAGTNAQSRCINTAITNITYATTGATGASVTGLPTGITGSFASNTVTISGTPTVSGIFTYTVTLTGGCGTITANGSITVTANNTISLSSAIGTNNQTKCINTSITNITYSTTGATGATVTGLPTGVTGSFAANTVTISGTPTVIGTFNYTVTLTGGCGTIIATGSILVAANNSISLSSAIGTNNQTKCINTAITNITYTTTGATGANVTGLPTGVTGSFAANTVTISGTPTASGTFIYTVTLTGGCGTTTANGSITVTANNTISLSSAIGTNAQTRCVSTPITNITYTTTGATGAIITGLPTGVTGSFAANTVTIGGTPTASGNFNYLITLTGGCGTVSESGSIIVSVNNTITLSSGAGSNIRSVCLNATIPNITYTATGATGATFTGLPTGVTGSFNAGSIVISGAPIVTGTFNYTVTLTGGCGTVTATGTITSAALSITTGVIASPICIGSFISVPYTISGCTPPSSHVFTAQLSDATGSFTNPVNIGVIASNAIGTINAFIPATTPTGAGYRIRVVSSLLNVTGTVNASNLTINPSFIPAVSISSNSSPGLICSNTSITFTAVPVNGALRRFISGR